MRKCISSKALLLVGLSLLLTVAACAPARAAPISPADSQAIEGTWVNWDPSAVGCSAGSTTTGIDISGNNAKDVFNFFVQNGYTAMQAAGIVGNMQIESGVQPERLEGTPSGTITPAESYSGSGGWGIVQWTPGTKFINTNNPISKANDLAVQAQFVWDQLAGNGPIPEKQAGDDLKSTTTLEDAVRAFMGDSEIGGKYIGFERPLRDYALQTLPDRIAAAQIVLREYGGTAGSTTGTCAGGGGSAIAGDAVKTAINYAWPDYHPAPYVTMTASYQAAVQAAQANGEYVGGIIYPGVDCGGFITRVMRNSGVDPNYNWGPHDPRQGATTQQQAYLESSPLYQKLGPQTSTANLQPGDIAINSEHTFMYVGQQPGFNGNSASASLDDRAPMASTAYFSNSAGPFMWYRLIK